MNTNVQPSQSDLSSERSPVIMRYHEQRYFDVLQQCCVLSMLTGSEPTRSSLIGRLLAIVQGTLFILTKLLSANAMYLWPFGCTLFLIMSQHLHKHTDIRETGFSDDFIAQTCNRSVLIERTCVYSEVCWRFDVPVVNLFQTHLSPQILEVLGRFCTYWKAHGRFREVRFLSLFDSLLWLGHPCSCISSNEPDFAVPACWCR